MSRNYYNFQYFLTLDELAQIFWLTPEITKQVVLESGIKVKVKVKKRGRKKEWLIPISSMYKMAEPEERMMILVERPFCTVPGSLLEKQLDKNQDLAQAIERGGIFACRLKGYDKWVVSRDYFDDVLDEG